MNTNVEVQRSWNKITDRTILTQNLTAASLYLMAWEVLCNEMIDPLKSFFSEWDNISSGLVVGEKYKNEVLDYHKEKLTASCLWLLRNGAISQDDIDRVNEFRRHRNEIAHEISRILMDSRADIKVEHLKEMRDLTRKIGVWWIQNFEIPCNPEFDGQDVDDEDIQPTQVMVLDLIYSLAVSPSL